jgi:hypothetical protein
MNKYVLVNSNTGEPLKIGDPVITFRGEEARLVGMTPPRREGSSGRVELALGNGNAEYYPSVIGAEFEVRP